MEAKIEGSGDWNDDAILELFEDAIKTHRTKKGEKRKRVQWSTSVIDPGETPLEAAPSANESNLTREQQEEGECEEDETDPIGVQSSSKEAPVPAVNYMQSQTRLALSGQNMAEEALSSMLMAWYQSGYATGRYETIIELQQRGLLSSEYREENLS